MASLGVATLGSEFDQSGMEAGLNKAQSFTNSFLSTWQNAFSSAMGFIIRDVIMGLGRAIVNLGKDALNATAEWERMGLSMESMVARELRAADGAAQLALAMKDVSRGMISTAKAQELAESRTMSMTESLAQASGRTKELLSWIQKLAIQSPFDVKSVQNAFQTALAYGFTTKEAQKLTTTMIDFAAATGKDAGVMNNVALALGQIRAKGKLAGQEILQLVNAGVPVNDMLKTMGYTLSDVSNGLVKSDEFLAAFTDTLDHDFGGAAARQTETWAGLVNSFEDIKKIGLRTLFDGVFDALQPVAVSFATWLQGPGMKVLERMGNTLGRMISNFLELGRAIGRFQYFFKNLDKGMTVAGALHRIFPELNLDGAVSKKFIGFLENSVGIVKTIVSNVENIGTALGGVAKRAKFFFTNLQKGMSFEGALQRIVPEIDVKGLIGSIADALKSIGGGAVAAAATYAGVLIGGNIISGIGMFLSSTAVSGLALTALTTFFSTKFGTKIIDALFKVFTAVFPKISWIGWLAGALGPSLAGFVTFIAPILLVAGAIMLVVGAFQMFQEGSLSQPIADLQAALASMGATFAALLPTLQQLGGQIWQGFLDSSKQLASQVIPWLVEQFTKIATWFETNRPLIERFLGVVADAITNGLLPAIVGMWQFVGPILTGIVDLVLGIATAIMQIATGDWAGAWSTILATVQQVGTAISTAVYGFLNWIANIMGTSLAEIGTIWTNNWNAFVQIVTTMAGMIIQGFIDGLSNGQPVLIAWLISYWEVIIKVVKAIFGIASPSTVFFDIATNLIQGLINGINAMLSMVIVVFTNLFFSIQAVAFMGLNLLFLIVQTAFTTIYNFFVLTFNAWILYFTNIWLTISTITNLAWIFIQTIIITALTGLSEIIFGFAKPIADSIQELFNKAINSATTLAKGFISAGDAIIDGIITGISNGAGAVLEAIKSVIESAIAAAMSALDANSPSVVFTNIGSYIPSGLSLGITDNVGAAIKAVESASLQIGMASVPQGVGGTGPGALDGSFALAGTNRTPGQSVKQVGPFYGPVYVGKLEDLEQEDPLSTAKVQ